MVEMLEFAKHDFGLRRLARNGQTFRQLYEDIEQQTGRRARELDGPPMPALCASVWRWFQDLSGKRTYAYGMDVAVPNPISYTEMLSYFSMSGEKPKPWQRRLLDILDLVYRDSMNRTDSGTAGSFAALKAAAFTE